MGTSGIRRRLSWLILQFAVLCFGLALLAIIYPHKWHFGTITISLRHLRNPLIGFCLALFVWRRIVDPADTTRGVARAAMWLVQLCERQTRLWRDRLTNAWYGWNWPGRVLFALASINLVLAVLHGNRYPKILEVDRENRANALTTEDWRFAKKRLPSLEYFAQQVVRQTPPDARILFEGRTAGLRFAYEVYPRRVFMLPQVYREMAAEWHVAPWLVDPPEDKHIAYWHQFLPHDVVNSNEFVREHRITYVASFDELNLSRCSLERVR